MESINNEYVSVLVPERHLAKVYGLIATLEGESNVSAEVATATETETEAKEDRDGRPISSAGSSRSRRGQSSASRDCSRTTRASGCPCRTSQPRWTRSMARSRSPAHWCERRRTVHGYKMTGWPFATRWLHAEGEQSYCMSPEVADIIKAL